MSPSISLRLIETKKHSCFIIVFFVFMIRIWKANGWNNLRFIFKNNLLNIGFSVLNHDFSFLLDQPFDFAQGDGNKKIFMRYYCFFVFMTRAWKANRWNNLRFNCLKIKNLKTTSKHRSAPRAVRQKAQLAERCHSVFSLFFYVFNLRAGVKLVMIKFSVYF